MAFRIRRAITSSRSSRLIHYRPGPASTSSRRISTPAARRLRRTAPRLSTRWRWSAIRKTPHLHRDLPSSWVLSACATSSEADFPEYAWGDLAGSMPVAMLPIYLHRVATQGDFGLRRVSPQVATVGETQINCGLLAQRLGTRCFEPPAGSVRIPGAQGLVR